ncbi:MAG: MFS transporter [Candidatus Omnitrophica bacterium]|nr:MFS transporter [Candidatus Omnitrophota bacterium]MBU4333750.1 MFS transporter [Candidatus Omnitrophota bacterium]
MIKILTSSKHRNFQRLWLAQFISQFGDRIHQLALVGLIAERAPGSAMGLAKLLAFTILPVFIIQPFAGVLVDRWDRKKTLFICDLARGLLVLTIPFLFIFKESMLPIYAVVFLAFCFSRFYIPAKMSMIPDLVEEDNLLVANSLVSTTGMMAFVFGCALGGFLIDWFGARNGFIIDSITFFVSGLIIYSISIPINLKFNKDEILKSSHEIVATIKRSFWVELKEGFIYLIQHKEIRFIIDMMFALLFVAGSVYVVMIVFIQESFGSVTKHLGVLAVCLGAGLFAGALCYGKWGKKFLWYKVIFFSLMTGGAMLIAFACVVARVQNIFAAMMLAALLGLVIGPIFIAANTVVHLVSDEKMRGKVFSAMEIVIHFAFLIAMFVSSIAAKYVDKFWILIAVGGSIVVIGLIGFIRGEHEGESKK